MATAKVACSVQNLNLCGSYGDGADLFTSAAVSVWHLKNEPESHEPCFHVSRHYRNILDCCRYAIMLISQCPPRNVNSIRIWFKWASSADRNESSFKWGTIWKDQFWSGNVRTDNTLIEEWFLIRKAEDSDWQLPSNHWSQVCFFCFLGGSLGMPDEVSNQHAD